MKKPTLEQVREYVSDNLLTLDPEQFHDHYESIGWVVGRARTPMKCWKAAVRNWARNEKRFRSPERPVKGTPSTPRQWQQWTRENGLGDGPRGFSEEQFVAWAQAKHRRMSK